MGTVIVHPLVEHLAMDVENTAVYSCHVRSVTWQVGHKLFVSILVSLDNGPGSLQRPGSPPLRNVERECADYTSNRHAVGFCTAQVRFDQFRSLNFQVVMMETEPVGLLFLRPFKRRV